MASPTKLVVLIFIVAAVSSPPSASAKTFRCASTATCNAVVDYISPNATTLSAIQTLFTAGSLLPILGANNLPLTTAGSHRVGANETVKIPFPCACSNGTGKSDGRPVYKVVAGDGLYHIAAEVFANLVTFPEIQAANGLPDANNITVGQNLTIPLPCSCDDVGGEAVVHYGFVVPAGSSVDGIAQQFNVSQDTLVQLNNLGTPPQLLAADVLDVPLKVCSSMISNTSLDYPLLVQNDSYTVTANGCVKCKCDTAMNLMLQCEPARINSSCPVIRCEGSPNLLLGNITSSGCNTTTCSYAGYNPTIQTMLDSVSTCPASPSPGSPNPGPPSPGSSSPGSYATSLKGWRWNGLEILVHAVMVCLVLV